MRQGFIAGRCGLRQGGAGLGDAGAHLLVGLPRRLPNRVHVTAPVGRDQIIQKRQDIHLPGDFLGEAGSRLLNAINAHQRFGLGGQAQAGEACRLDDLLAARAVQRGVACKGGRIGR